MSLLWTTAVFHEGPDVCDEHGRRNCGLCVIGSGDNFEPDGNSDPVQSPKCDTHGVRGCEACGY